MTDNASVPAMGADLTTADYEQMLDDLDAAIAQARYKLDGDGRLRDIERERLRVKYLHEIGYLINVRRKVAHDRDLEALAEKIEQVEQRLAGEAVMQA